MSREQYILEDKYLIQKELRSDVQPGPSVKERFPLFYIVHDWQSGSPKRIEIPAEGHGEMQVCIGHKYVHEHDGSGLGKKVSIPVFNTFRW